MSKSTKVIAALGVAAGLGIAALPAASFAATTADVELQFTVPDALSISVDSADVDFGDILAGASDTATTETTITANATTGYNLTVAATSATSATATSAVFTATHGATPLAPWAINAAIAPADLDEAAAGWGMKLNAMPTTAGVTYTPGSIVTTAYNGVPNTAVSDEDPTDPTFTPNSATIYTTGALTTQITDEPQIDYAVKLPDNQAAGVYTANITYTVANNS